jgi:hypothetical protein
LKRTFLLLVDDRAMISMSTQVSRPGAAGTSAEKGSATGAVQPDRWIRWTTTAAVLVLAGIAAVVSFRHMRELALPHGEDEPAAALIPPAGDGTIVAASMSLLRASRHGARGGVLPWALLIVSSLAGIGANMAEPTLIARLIAGWPGLALISAYEMLMCQIRHSAGREPSPGGRMDAGLRGEVTEPARRRGEQVSVRRCEGERALQRAAWQWAKGTTGEDGSAPYRLAIARQFQRSPRWGRLVKKAGCFDV